MFNFVKPEKQYKYWSSTHYSSSRYIALGSSTGNTFSSFLFSMNFLNVVSLNPTQAIQHYVIKFVGGFLWVLRFPPPIKLTATI